MDLVEFLRARLDEKERAARAATPGPWAWDVGDGSFKDEPSGSSEWGHLGPDLMSGAVEVITSCGYDGDNVIVRRADAEHIARHDPARVLAEVEAKRAIVDEHGAREVASLDHDTWGRPFTVCRRCRVSERQVVYPCPTLRLMASVYSAHPDYRPEWKP